MKYRKRPIVINAWKVSDILQYVLNSWKRLPKEVKEGYEKGTFIFTDDGIHVKTLEGVRITGRNDMLIQDVKGEFYGCKPDIFEATYELVEDTP